MLPTGGQLRLRLTFPCGSFQTSPADETSRRILAANWTGKAVRAMVNVGDRVGALCAQLSRWDSLEGIVRDGGAGEALDELVAAVRGDAAQEPDRLARLLDDIEEACAHRGLAGITSRGTASPDSATGLVRLSGRGCKPGVGVPVFPL